MSTTFERVCKDLQNQNRTCRLLNENPLCFQVDNKYDVYKSLIGDWIVEVDGDEIGKFIANFEDYIVKATIKIITSYESK